MKRFYLVLTSVLALVCALTISFQTDAKSKILQAEASFVSPNPVISQFQTGGGTVNDEFIEILNTSSQSVDLNGYRVVYRSAGGTNDVNFAAWTTSTIVPPGGYYLIVSNSYDGSTPGDFTYNTSTCSCALSVHGRRTGDPFRRGKLRRSY